MKDKKEIKFNVEGLVSAWLFGTDRAKISNLILTCSGDNIQSVIPCRIDEAIDEITNILYNNNKGYSACQLSGIVDKKQKVLGIIDIN